MKEIIELDETELKQAVADAVNKRLMQNGQSPIKANDVRIGVEQQDAGDMRESYMVDVYTAKIVRTIK